MANTDFRSVDEYLAKQPAATRKLLQQVRAVIRKAVPKADETISYQIPAYKLDGRVMLYFAGWKDHFSLYPATGLVNEVLGDEIAKYKVSKGTLRFSLADEIPTRLIAKLAKLRAQETAERSAAKRAKAKKTKKS